MFFLMDVGSGSMTEAPMTDLAKAVSSCLLHVFFLDPPGTGHVTCLIRSYKHGPGRVAGDLLYIPGTRRNGWFLRDSTLKMLEIAPSADTPP